MSRGKYSPYSTSEFIFDRWETGTSGTVEVDKDGFDYYGYDANGKDVQGFTEDDYLFMDDDAFCEHVWWGKTQRLHKMERTPEEKLQAVHAKLKKIANREILTHGECAIVAQELIDEFFGGTK